MPWRVECDEQRKVICLAFEGQVSDDDVRDSSVSVVGMIAEKGVRDILTDFTGVTRLEISTLGVFELPKDYKDLGLHGWFREAIVSPGNSVVQESVSFYATVCLNRGYSIRTFENRSQALDWLASVKEASGTERGYQG